MEIHGTCDARFQRVRDAFVANFEERGDPGAAVAVVLRGQPLVHLWGGFADKAEALPWAPDTLVNLASATKGMLAVCAHHLVEAGRLRLDAAVADDWPEFGQASKGAVTVRQLLCHTAGLPGVRAPLPPEALFDQRAMATALAAEAPFWEPGTQHGYHAMTIGYLVGELVLRVAGKSVGAYFRDEIAAPRGLDLHIGLQPAEEARTADVRSMRPNPREPSFVQTVLAEPDSLAGRAFLNPQLALLPRVLNSHAWRAADLPFANGHGTALGLARLYDALVQGKILSAETLAEARKEHAYGHDVVLRETTRFGLGFMLSHPTAPFGRSGNAFGHPGAGGFLGFGDPDVGLGFGYVTAKMGLHPMIDPRADALAKAVHDSLV